MKIPLDADGFFLEAHVKLRPVDFQTDGLFVAYPNCNTIAGILSCGGPSRFLEPDTGRVLEGPVALTLAPIERPLVQDVFLDFVMRGPLDVSHSFLISAEK